MFPVEGAWSTTGKVCSEVMQQRTSRAKLNFDTLLASLQPQGAYFSTCECSALVWESSIVEGCGLCMEGSGYDQELQQLRDTEFRHTQGGEGGVYACNYIETYF